MQRTEDPDRPLITFLLMTYNQERFVREAVAGAFAQTYSPLEILLSDDCSADRTFEVMSEMADSYRGPHKIVRNRNPRNLGIGAHVNRAVEIAGGELVVAAAGDDVSLGARTERIFEEWERSGGGACSIYSDAICIDPEGREVGRLFGGSTPSHARSVEEAVARGGVGVAGCTHAFTKKWFDVFGPLDRRVVAEDMVIPFRNLLLGCVLRLNEPLVRYRTHGGNISGLGRSRPTLAMRIREVENHESVYGSWESDLRLAAESGILPAGRAERAIRDLSGRRYWLDVEKRYYMANPVSGLGILIGSAMKSGNIVQPGKIIEKRVRTGRPDRG
jgi:glycosyltransferase involved in cell wall biosynthesis